MKNLKKIREERGFMQKDVASHLGISRQRYSNYETEKREPDNQTMLMLAKFFNTTTSYLLGETDDPTPPGERLSIPDSLKDVKVAFHRGEFEDLTQSEVDALAKIAETLKAQRKL